MQPRSRVARFLRIARKDAAAVTNEELIPAPGVGRRIVIDLLYFNASAAATIEMYFNATAWSDADGLVGGAFGANGGFIGPLVNLEGGENQPLRWTTTITGTTYLILAYHLET